MTVLYSILALILLAAISWIAAYAVCLALLSRSLWSPRLHLEHRFPPQRFKKINRVISTVVGLILAGMALIYCAPAAFNSIQSPPPQEESQSEKKKVPGPRKPDMGRESPTPP